MNHLFKILLAAFMLSSCAKPQPVKSYDLRPIIHATVAKLHTQDTTRLEFCKITEFNWDELLIIPPYSFMSDVKAYDVKNTGAVSDQVDHMNYTDQKVLFLFLKNDTIVRYSFVEHTKAPIMFHYINYDFPKKKLSKDEICNKLYVEKDSSTIHYLKM